MGLREILAEAAATAAFEEIKDEVDTAFEKGGPREALVLLREMMTREVPPHTPGMPCAACFASSTAEVITYILNQWN